MRSALLFPGQGSQYPGMLHRLPPGDATDRTLADAAQALAPTVDLGTVDRPTSLEDEVPIQVAVRVAGVAVARTLRAAGARWDFVAGHSVGAFTAAVAAEALDFPDAVRLVRLRARTMADLYPAGSGYGMLALTGLTESRVRALAATTRAETREPVYPANVNAPSQITVSGSGVALSRLAAVASTAGARRVVLLAVPVPSHCPLMRPVADRLADELSALLAAGRLRNPRAPAVAAVDARLLTTAQTLAHDLAGCVAAPVRWHDATTALYEREVRLFVEAPPGRVLTGLVTAAFPGVRAYAVGEDGVESATVLFRSSRSRDRGHRV